MPVSALFVDRLGPYPSLVSDWWDRERDARRYAGPNPVVAHPPCQLWVNFAALNFKRYGGEHNRPGNDGGCFASAVSNVIQWGGVLEHPAGSKAWPAYCLPRPSKNHRGWERGVDGWVCEVWQSAYGHPARKRTWLFYSGQQPPLDLDWTRKPGTHQVGWFDRNKPTLSKREASATPIAFAKALVDLAQHATEQLLSGSVPVGMGAR